MTASPAESLACDPGTMALARPEDSLLAFFTPSGWGVALTESGLTAAAILGEMKYLIQDDEIRPEVKLAAIKFFLEHSEKVLRLNGAFAKTTDTLEVKGTTENPEVIRRIESEYLRVKRSQEIVAGADPRGLPGNQHEDLDLDIETRTPDDDDGSTFEVIDAVLVETPQ